MITKVVKKSKRGAKPGERRGGRGKGTANKVTTDARAAIAAFVNQNAGRMQGWLDQIANGSPGDEEKGIDPTPGNPERAFAMLRDLIEYHVPKLGRTEHTGKDGAELPTRVLLEFVGGQSSR